MAEVHLPFPSSSSSSSSSPASRGAAMDYQLLRSQFPSLMSPSLRSNRFGLEFSPSMKAFLFPKGCKGIEAVHKNSHETWWEKPFTPLLDSINFPIQLKSLNLKALKQLADEVRLETICAASESGVDSGSSLSVVELTIALHYVFNTPEDKIIWDMGHQTIPHKILTGRRSRVHTIRKKNGLSGFPKRSESEYDPFGSGHTSSSISAGLGMAAARDLKGKRNHIVSIIGDLAMTAGQAYEAMNNAGYLDTNMIVILNDNKREVSRTLTENAVASSVGPLGSAISKIQSNRSLRELREFAKGVTKSFGGSMHEFAAKVDEYARGMISGSESSFFEELGLYYIGPVDGHNIDDLVTILREVKEARTAGPVLIHVITEKGHGRYNEKSAQSVSGYRSHATVSHTLRGKRSSKLYTNYFAEALIAEAEIDKDIVGIHAAMAGGTGLNMFAERFPDRCFDVGIAEQHAVTFAAGLACEGMKPFCAIHSSFLQRAYDQVVHDVALQNLPVRFALDRAGLVGPDGPTHCGAFDVTYMACLPNMVVMAPSDEADLIHMVATAIAINDRPSCIRYPRGYGVGVPLPTKYKGTPLEIGRGRVLTEGTQVALLGYGAMVQNCLVAESILAQQYKVSTTVFDARFCKPLDCQLIRQIAKTHEVVITVEEGSVGGFGSHIAQFLALDGLLDGKLKVRPVMLPDRYIEHASPAEQLAEAGLTAAHIAATVLNILGRTRDALQVML